MAFGNTQICHEKGNRLRGHARSSIGMDQKLSRLDQLLLHGLFNQFKGKSGKLSLGHHPPHHIAAEDVQNDIEVINRSTSPVLLILVEVGYRRRVTSRPIEIFYNRQRRQARLGYLSPVAYGQQFYRERCAA
jgi:hypothetical protein